MMKAVDLVQVDAKLISMFVSFQECRRPVEPGVCAAAP